MFLSDAADSEATADWQSRATFVSRRSCPATLQDLFALKASLRPALELSLTPYIVEEQPDVIAWYPSARKTLVRNLSENSTRLTVRTGTRNTPITAAPLELAEVENL